MKWISSTSDKYWQEKKIETDVQSAHRAVITADQAQRIKGFGGCFNELGYHALKKAGSSDREKVFDQLFGQNNCRFSFCRVPIGASDYALSWYSHSEVAEDYKLKNFNIDRDRQNLLPYIKEAQKVNPEIDFFASPWSPPVWMKTMQTFNYGNLRWEEPVLKTYALYFKKFVEAFAAEGIKISQVHVQNEPRSNQKFPSCVWTGSKMRDFIKDYLGPLFKKENIPCEIWAGTIEKGIEHGYHCDKVGKEDFSSWAHTILSDPDCRKYVSGVGYQWDGKGALQRTRHAFPEVPIIQTENECGDGQNSWAYALYVFNLMWDYFTNGAAAYVYWNMVLPQGGESTWGWHQNAMINIADEGQVIYNPEFYIMKHFAAFVKPGAVRLQTQGDWSAFTLAFRNPDNKVVSVFINPYDSEKEVTLANRDDKLVCKCQSGSINTVVL